MVQGGTLGRRLHCALSRSYFSAMIEAEAASAEFAAIPMASIGRNPVVAWLLDEGWNITCPRQLTRRFGMFCNAAGIPLYRLRVLIRTLHPQFLGTAYAWKRDIDEVEEILPTHDVITEDRFLKSPYAALFEGAGAIRRRLEGAAVVCDFPVLADLKAEGATDYVAMPLVFSDGKINAISLASDRPGGFASRALQTIDEALPVLARLYEVHALRRTARTILETYLGRQTGERVLQGLIRRGDGSDIFCVIWFSDLRDSTTLADTLPRGEFLAILDAYFGAIAGAVLDYGGEVLRFIGDAALAIFPIDGEPDDDGTGKRQVAERALAAARDALSRLDAINEARTGRGETPIAFGIGLHIGAVLYGNVGAPERLEFTVIGPAVNEAARIEDLCKTLHKPLLFSEIFARAVPQDATSLGHHALRGVRARQEIFTLATMPPHTVAAT